MTIVGCYAVKQNKQIKERCHDKEVWLWSFPLIFFNWWLLLDKKSIIKLLRRDNEEKNSLKTFWLLKAK